MPISALERVDAEASREGAVNAHVSCIACGAGAAEPYVTSRAQMSASRSWFEFSRCRACGLVYLDPPPSGDALRTYYENYLPHRGSGAWGRFARFVDAGQRATDRARVRLARQVVALDHRHAVLDVGCGRPTFLEALRARTGARAVGFDWSSAGWTAAGDDWRGLELHEGELDGVAVDGAFDLITLWHVLEHLDAPVRTLEMLRGRARPGASIVVEVPDVESLTARMQGAGWAGFHTPRHMAAYSARTLAGVLERAGWRDVQVRRHGTLDPFVLWWLGRQERAGWPSGSMEPLFPAFLLRKILTLPVTAMQSLIPLGIMTAVARA